MADLWALLNQPLEFRVIHVVAAFVALLYVWASAAPASSVKRRHD